MNASHASSLFHNAATRKTLLRLAHNSLAFSLSVLLVVSFCPTAGFAEPTADSTSETAIEVQTEADDSFDSSSMSDNAVAACEDDLLDSGALSESVMTTEAASEVNLADSLKGALSIEEAPATDAPGTALSPTKTSAVFNVSFNETALKVTDAWVEAPDGSKVATITAKSLSLGGTESNQIRVLKSAWMNSNPAACLVVKTTYLGTPITLRANVADFKTTMNGFHAVNKVTTLEALYASSYPKDSNTTYEQHFTEAREYVADVLDVDDQSATYDSYLTESVFATSIASGKAPSFSTIETVVRGGSAAGVPSEETSQSSNPDKTNPSTEPTEEGKTIDSTAASLISAGANALISKLSSSSGLGSAVGFAINSFTGNSSATSRDAEEIKKQLSDISTQLTKVSDKMVSLNAAVAQQSREIKSAVNNTEYDLHLSTIDQKNAAASTWLSSWKNALTITNAAERTKVMDELVSRINLTEYESSLTWMHTLLTNSGSAQYNNSLFELRYAGIKSTVPFEHQIYEPMQTFVEYTQATQILMLDVYVTVCNYRAGEDAAKESNYYVMEANRLMEQVPTRLAEQYQASGLDKIETTTSFSTTVNGTAATGWRVKSTVNNKHYVLLSTPIDVDTLATGKTYVYRHKYFKWNYGNVTVNSYKIADAYNNVTTLKSGNTTYKLVPSIEGASGFFSKATDKSLLSWLNSCGINLSVTDTSKSAFLFANATEYVENGKRGVKKKGQERKYTNVKATLDLNGNRIATVNDSVKLTFLPLSSSYAGETCGTTTYASTNHSQYSLTAEYSSIAKKGAKAYLLYQESV